MVLGVEIPVHGRHRTPIPPCHEQLRLLLSKTYSTSKEVHRNEQEKPGYVAGLVNVMMVSRMNAVCLDAMDATAVASRGRRGSKSRRFGVIFSTRFLGFWCLTFVAFSLRWMALAFWARCARYYTYKGL